MSQHKIYIGDSVYADFDGFNLILTTENGYGPSNTIYLEPGLLRKIVDYYQYKLNPEEIPTSAEGTDG
ncbi:MAG: hypothetical protein ACREOP_04950 [Thermodesulfobacteriota bacterium]